MLTIFSTCKPFRDHFAIIQRNAITSWTLLRPKPEIILFGDEEGVAEICQELGLRHVPEIARNEFGTPLVSDLFEKAQRLATYEILCYVNADIVLMHDFAEAIEQVRKWKKKFLIVGGCLEADIVCPIDFKQNWEEHLKIIAQNSGRSKPGPDYFVFPIGLYSYIPPFAIGRFYWEGWLTWKAASVGATIVDATPGVCAIHQTHDYSHTGRDDDWVWNGEETQKNMELSGGWVFQYSVNNAHYKLTPQGLKKATEWRYIVGRLEPWRRRFIDWTRPLRHALGLRQETLKIWLRKWER
jgi:hypothetical protein